MLARHRLERARRCSYYPAVSAVPEAEAVSSDLPSWMREARAEPTARDGVRDRWRDSPRFRHRAIVALALLAVAAILGVVSALLPEHVPKKQDSGGGGAGSPDAMGSIGVIVMGTFLVAFLLAFLFTCRGLVRELRSPTWTRDTGSTGPSPRELEAARGTERTWQQLGRRHD